MVSTGYSRQFGLLGCCPSGWNAAGQTSQSGWSCCCRRSWHFQKPPWWDCGAEKEQGHEPGDNRGPLLGCFHYLLSSSASSTCDVLSLDDTSSECWLMADRNFRISLVLSVFPAPLSPLRAEKHMAMLKHVAGSKGSCLFQHEGPLWHHSGLDSYIFHLCLK